MLVADTWIGAACDLLPAELEEGLNFAGDERVRVVLRRIVPVKPHGLVSTTFLPHWVARSAPNGCTGPLMDHSLLASMTQRSMESGRMTS